MIYYLVSVIVAGVIIKKKYGEMMFVSDLVGFSLTWPFLLVMNWMVRNE